MEPATLAAECFGITVDSVKPLPGYEDWNYRITAQDGSRFVLKVARQGADRLALEGQVAALDHLAKVAPDLPVPRVIRSELGPVVTRDERQIRLLTWLDGEFLAQVDSTAMRMRSFGSVLGRLDAALADFRHSGLDRTMKWDLLDVLRECGDLDALADPWRRNAVEHLLCQLEQRMPDLLRLRRGLIHNDANDHNVLVDGEGICGLIDFGDMLESAMAGELAVAATYAMMGADEPLATGAELVAGYHAEYALEPAELAAIYPLICARLCLSVVHSARSSAADPTNTYITVSEQPAWRLIKRLLGTHPDAAEAGFRRACGLDSSAPAATDDALASRRQHLPANLSLNHTEPLKIGRGVMQYLYDESGREFLDLVNNVCHVGHGNPRVVRAAARQMARLNTNTRYLHDNINRYAERLVAKLPPRLEVCFLVCSGSEANELALRLASTFTGRREVAVLDNAYHGNTQRLVDVSPYKFNGPGGGGCPDWVQVIDAPEDVVGPIGAFLSEGIRGCAGQVVPEAGFLAETFARVRDGGGVCVSDEVQIGFGRVGTHFWGFELHDVVPDIVTMGKPIGNGHPLAAVVTTREIAAAFDNGMEYFNTFGGNPVSCAVGLAVLDEIEDRGLQEAARVLGNRLRNGVLALGSPAVVEVRGSGLFLGVQLASAQIATDVTEAMKADGILVAIEGPGHDVLKIKPPLVITPADVDRAVASLGRALRDRRDNA